MKSTMWEPAQTPSTRATVLAAQPRAVLSPETPLGFLEWVPSLLSQGLGKSCPSLGWPAANGWLIRENKSQTCHFRVRKPCAFITRSSPWGRAQASVQMKPCLCSAHSPHRPCFPGCGRFLPSAPLQLATCTRIPSQVLGNPT